MSYKLNFDSGAAVIPISALRKLSDGTTAENIRALCLLAEYGLASRPFDTVVAEISAAGLMSEEKLRLSAAYWHGAGVLTSNGTVIAQNQKAPAALSEKLQTGAEAEAVTSEKIRDWMDNNIQVQNFIKTCEDIYGDLFNQTELTVILTFSREYRMKDECIFMILGYCKDNSYGIGYAKKLFARMVDNGIDNIEDVRKELEFLQSHTAYSTSIKRIFGIDRALTSYEKPIVEKWQKEYSFTPEIIQLAFDRAAASGKAKISYCNKMMIAWREEGLMTADEIRAAIDKRREDHKKTEASNKKNSSFSTDDFFAAAISRSYKKKEN